MAGPQSSFENLLGSGSGSGSGSSIGPVPIHHMDYAYIGLCKNVKELERILEALRSGENGHYPDLIKSCEERIVTLDPKSKALRKDKPPASASDLGREEWQQINSDIKDWATEMGKDSTPSAARNDGDKNLPPIRQPATVETSGKKKEDKDKLWGQPSKERIKSSDYKAWDKFDAEKAAEKGDMKKDGVPAKKSSTAVGSTINTEGMSDKERELVANKEKDKGNEAFKAGDFEEAVQYYSRSISVIPSAPAYNNRSLARIKLCRFIAAVEDCTKVLELEPENIKALLRRGTALKSLRRLTAAKDDLKAVLNAEPNNKQALDILADIMLKETVEINLPKSDKERDVKIEPTLAAQPTGRRMIIQEVDEESNSEEEDDGKGQGSLVNGTAAPNPSEGAVNGETSASSIDAVATEDQDGGQGAVSAETSHPTSNGNPVLDGPVAPATPPVPNPIPALPLPDDVIALKDSGNELFKSGQYGNAMEKYSFAIKKILADKDSFTAALASLYNNRAACNSKTGHLKETIEDCDAALEIQPYSAKAMLRRGAAYEALEKYRHAYVDYQTAMKVDMASQTAQTGAARLMKILSEQDGPKWRQKLPSTPSMLGLPFPPPSVTTMAPSNAPVPSVTTTTNAASRPSMTTSQVQGQEVKGQEGKGQEGKGQEVKGDTVVPKPSSQDQSDRAPGPDGNASKGSSEKVRGGSRVQAQADPLAVTDPKLSVKDNFLKLKTEGNTLVQQGSYAKAVEFYTACIALDPNQLVSYTNRALCFIKLLKGNEAEIDCTRALELDDRSIKALYRRALARKMLHKYSDGARDLTSLLKIEPSNASAKKELDSVKELWRHELKDNQQKAAKKPKQTTQPPPAQLRSEVKPSEVNSAEVKPAEANAAKGTSSEVKFSEATPAEVTPAEVIPAEVTPAEVTPAEVIPAEVTPAEANAAEVKSTKDESSDKKSSEVKPAEVKSADVKPAEVKSAGVKPTNGKSSQVKPAEVKPAEVKPAKGKSSEVKPTKKKLAEVKPKKGKTSEVKQAEVKSTEVKPAKAKSSEVKPSEVKPSEINPADVKPGHKKKRKGKRVQIQEVEGSSDNHEENDVKKVSPKPNEKPPTKDKKDSKTPKDTGNQKGDKTPGGKDNKVTVPKLTKVTAYEFLQAWTSLKRQRSMLAYAELLKQISPEELPEVLTNKLDGDMVVNIVKAVCEHLVESDADFSYGLLANLPKVERFKTVVLFLSTSDKKRLRNTLKKLSIKKSDAYAESDIDQLRPLYSL